MSSMDRWIHGEGRLGEPALRSAAGDAPDLPGPGQQVIRRKICWRCGATPATSSPCTEKRGDGPPWRHQFLDRDLDHPWTDWDLDDLEALCLYLGGKARSSLLTATAFGDLVDNAKLLRLSRARVSGHMFARGLYREKAAKRILLFDWALAEFERRLKESLDATDHPDPR